MTAPRKISLAKLQGMEVHPFAELFPFAAVEEIEGIAAHMAQAGFRESRAIVVFEGKILDGRNRRKALARAVEIKGKPISAYCQSFKGDAQAAFDFVLSENLNRRHLSTSQKAVIAANLVQWDYGMNQYTEGAANLRTQKHVSKIMGVSQRSIQFANKIRERGADLEKAVMDGKLTVNSAEALIELGDKELLDTLAQERGQIIARAREIREQNSGAAKAIGGLGNKTRTKEERGLDLYETPQCAIDTLLALEGFSDTIIEPSCGRGAISHPLEAKGYEVLLSDIEDRGAHTMDGEPAQIADFLESEISTKFDVVTNPPFNIANAFIAHALKGMLKAKPSEKFGRKKVAMLLNLNFMCGFDDPDRRFCMDEKPPARIYVFTRRLPTMHADDWDGNEASSSMNTAWFVWEKGFTGKPEIIRTDWKDYSTIEQPARCPCAACVTRLAADKKAAKEAAARKAESESEVA